MIRNLITRLTDADNSEDEFALCQEAADIIQILHKALDEIRIAAFCGYLTPEHCAEVVTAALAKVEMA